MQHTEAVHGRSMVHKGVEAWENSRGQSGLFSIAGADEHEGEVFLDEDQCYCQQSDTYDCPICNKEFRSFGGLQKHVNSPAHSSNLIDAMIATNNSRHWLLFIIM